MPSLIGCPRLTKMLLLLLDAVVLSATHHRRKGILWGARARTHTHTHTLRLVTVTRKGNPDIPFSRATPLLLCRCVRASVPPF
uniref:Putative secreted protein n=1 Tax=Anopheles darlingi TaxID=43151 RepID=A0A2M4D2W5_ANODA